MKGQVTAIVIDYYTRAQTLRLVGDLQSMVDEIIVVDNSGDAQHFEDWPARQMVAYVAADTRQGYGAGVNLGARHARGEYLLVCNSDLRWSKGLPSGLVECLAEGVGVAAPTIVDDSGCRQEDSAGYLPDVPRRLQKWPGWVTGACFLMARSQFNDIGGFDERYLMYWEDVDLCRRLWSRGLEAMVSPSVVVVHASGGSQPSRYARYELAASSRNIYLAKWRAPLWKRLSARARGQLKRNWGRMVAD